MTLDPGSRFAAANLSSAFWSRVASAGLTDGEPGLGLGADGEGDGCPVGLGLGRSEGSTIATLADGELEAAVAPAPNDDPVGARRGGRRARARSHR